MDSFLGLYFKTRVHVEYAVDPDCSQQWQTTLLDGDEDIVRSWNKDLKAGLVCECHSKMCHEHSLDKCSYLEPSAKSNAEIVVG